MRCLACDFGGSSVKYALVNENAELSMAGRRPAPLETKEQFVETIYSLYCHFKDKIDGIALSMPGYINPDTGYLYGSGAYRALYKTNIIDIIKEKCKTDISIENDGKCGALSEAWKGALADCEDGVVLILGSAVGGGIIKNKTVHWGKNFTAGELSYMITNPNACQDMMLAYMSVGMLGVTYKLCKYKHLDIAIQDSSQLLCHLDNKLQEDYSQKAARETDPVNEIKADGKHFFDWLEKGDKDAQRVYKEFIDNLAVLVHNIQVCYAPERIVIGGGLSRQERIFADLGKKLNSIYKNAEFGEMLHAEIVKSKYLDECNLIGAMYNFLEKYDKKQG